MGVSPTKGKGQEKSQSLVEALFSTAIGYIVSIVSQLLFFPLFSVSLTFSENLIIGCFFTVVSIIRGYFVRRLFNKFN